jgi:hypothetical protein
LCEQDNYHQRGAAIIAQGVLLFQYQNHKNGPDYRFVATGELVRRQLELPGCETTEATDQIQAAGGARYKIRGIATNRTVDGNEVIHWYRERCGKSEEVHAVMKDDLAGGKLLSGAFGENTAWWGIIDPCPEPQCRHEAFGFAKNWGRKRLKAIRLGLINLAGQVRSRSRRLQILISPRQAGYALLLQIRERIAHLARGWSPLMGITG